MKFKELYKICITGAVGYLSKDLVVAAKACLERKRAEVGRTRDRLTARLFGGPEFRGPAGVKYCFDGPPSPGKTRFNKLLDHKKFAVLTAVTGKTTTGDDRTGVVRDDGREALRLIEVERAMARRKD